MAALPMATVSLAPPATAALPQASAVEPLLIAPPLVPSLSWHSAAMTVEVVKEAAAIARERVLIFSAVRGNNSIFIVSYPF
jgi:hypothetical protein